MDNFMISTTIAEMLIRMFYPTMLIESIGYCHQGLEKALPGFNGHISIGKAGYEYKATDEGYCIFMHDGWGESETARKMHDKIANQLSLVDKARQEYFDWLMDIGGVENVYRDLLKTYPQEGTLIRQAYNSHFTNKERF